MADINITAGADFRAVDREMTRSERRAEQWANRMEKNVDRWNQRLNRIGTVAAVGVAAGIAVAGKAIRDAAEATPALARGLDDAEASVNRLSVRLGRDLADALSVDRWSDWVDAAGSALDTVSDAIAGAFESADANSERHAAERGAAAMDRQIAAGREFRDLREQLIQQEDQAFGTEETRAAAREAAASKAYRDTMEQINAQENLNAKQREELQILARKIRDKNAAAPRVGYNEDADTDFYLGQQVGEARDRYRLSGSAEDEKELRRREARRDTERISDQINKRTDLNDAQKRRHIEEETELIRRRYLTELELIDRAAAKEAEQEARERAQAQQDAADQSEDLRVQRLRLEGKDAEAEREQIRLDTARRIRDIEAETATTEESRRERIRQLRENEDLAIAGVGRGQTRSELVSAGVPLRQQLGTGNPLLTKADKTNELLTRIDRNINNLKPAVA